MQNCGDDHAKVNLIRLKYLMGIKFGGIGQGTKNLKFVRPIQAIQAPDTNLKVPDGARCRSGA